MAGNRERALLALPSVLICILDTSRVEGQEYLLYAYPASSPLLPLKALLLATHQISRNLLKQDIRTMSLAGHKAVLLPLFDCFLVGVVLPKIADSLIQNTAEFIRELIKTLCPRLEAFLRSPGHSDDLNPTPRASRTSAREGTKVETTEQMKTALDPIAQLALYRLLPFFCEDSEDFNSSPISEFYYTLPMVVKACALYCPLPMDIQVDVARALNSIYQDSSVVVHEIITIDSPQTFPVGSALFHNGFLLNSSLAKGQLQACVAVCLLWDLFSRTDSAPHFARTITVWVQGVRQVLTIVADYSLVLCLLLEPLEEKDQLGYDPVYLGKAEKALQILVRYELHTKVTIELNKLCIAPEQPSEGGPLSSVRRRYSASTPTESKTPSHLSVYSQGTEAPVQPMFVKGSDLPLFHFAGVTDLGLVFTHVVSASPDWFFYLYRPVLQLYSLLGMLNGMDVCVRLQIETSNPYRKAEGKFWQVWIGRHSSTSSRLYACYDEDTPRSLKLLTFSLAS